MEVRERLGWQAAAGIEAGRWVEGAEVRELEPAVTAELVGAAWYPGEGHVNSFKAVRALVAAATRRGAVVRSGATVVGAAPGGGVRLGSGEAIPAGNVVLAAGAWLREVGRAFGTELPVRPVHGQLVALRGLSTVPRRVVFAGLQGYLVARADGTVLAGATEEDREFETAADPTQTAALRRRAERLVPAAGGATELAAWTGLRPCAPDGLPLLGSLDTARGPSRVHVAGGHYRNGVLLAPVTARGMAECVLEGRVPQGWEAFAPGRRFAEAGAAR
jgi:glycine oxidase